MTQVSNVPAHTGAKRRSQRVLVQVGVRIRGKDAQGKDFEENTQTLAINAHGALVLLNARLTSGAVVHMKHNKTEEEQECHVAFLGPVRSGKSGNWSGVYRAASNVLACSLPSRRLDPEEPRSSHDFHQPPKQVTRFLCRVAWTWPDALCKLGGR